jgi:hypothetical protein
MIGPDGAPKLNVLSVMLRVLTTLTAPWRESTPLPKLSALLMIESSIGGKPLTFNSRGVSLMESFDVFDSESMLQ